MYIVCIDKCFIRDAQFFDCKGMSSEEFVSSDWFSSDNEERWKDISAPALISIVSANSRNEAIRIIAEKEFYDPNSLLAIPVRANN